MVIFSRDFEAEWREMTGVDHAITVCNGGAALYSSMFGLGMDFPIDISILR
jgi:dTDP-4-amino-4,6-dideoxygalactose transaminase